MSDRGIQVYQVTHLDRRQGAGFLADVPLIHYGEIAT